MKIIEKYILRELSKTSLLVLISMLCISFLTRISDFSHIIFSDGAGFKSAMMLILLTIPKLLSILIPFSLLLGSIIFFNSKLHSNELTIIKSVGINKFQILKIVLIISLSCFIFDTFLTMFIVPKTFTQMKEIEQQIGQNVFSSLIKSGNFVSKNNITMFVDNIEKNGNATNIFILDSRVYSKETIIFAKNGNIGIDNTMFQMNINNAILDENKIDKLGNTTHIFSTFDSFLGQFRVIDSRIKSDTYYGFMNCRDLLSAIASKNLFALQEFNERMSVPILCFMLPLCITICFMTLFLNTRMRNIKPILITLLFSVYAFVSPFILNYTIQSISLLILLPYINDIVLCIILFML